MEPAENLSVSRKWGGHLDRGGPEEGVLARIVQAQGVQGGRGTSGFRRPAGTGV